MVIVCIIKLNPKIAVIELAGASGIQAELKCIRCGNIEYQAGKDDKYA
jgi:hypothetical protein